MQCSVLKKHIGEKWGKGRVYHCKIKVFREINRDWHADILLNWMKLARWCGEMKIDIKFLIKDVSLPFIQLYISTFILSYIKYWFSNWFLLSITRLKVVCTSTGGRNVAYWPWWLNIFVKCKTGHLDDLYGRTDSGWM